jgi:hypothetical protein
VQLFIPGVKCIIKELHLGIAVAVDAPSHTQIRYLPDPVHGFNGTMAGLTFDLSDSYMLGMAEKYMILQVVYADPFDGGSPLISSHKLIDLMAPGVGSFPDQGMAIPADPRFGDAGRF